jgi:NADH:ubiquinone oxidoreductase subunit E
MSLMTKQLLVCTNFRANPNNPSCAARDSKLVLDKLQTELANNNIAIELVESRCMGYCSVGPNARLAPNGAFFHGMSATKLAKLIKAAKKFSTQ